MKIKFWTRTSFWTKVSVSLNVILTTLQGVLTASEANHKWNYFFLALQLVGNLINLWSEDKNHDDIPDIIQKQVKVTVTGPNDETDIKVETETVTPPK